MPLLEWMMAEAPTVKIKVVKERKAKDSKKERNRNNGGRSKGQKAMNPRRR